MTAVARGKARKGRKRGEAARGERRRGTRVLVVDDDEAIRRYLAKLLELKGYEVDTAEDGRSALVLLDGGAAPDVVILDIMMPGIDGLETLRSIRQLDAKLPVVMLSALGRASTIVEAMQLGATDYLNKPFEEEQLAGILAKLEKRRNLEVEHPTLFSSVSRGQIETVCRNPAMRKIFEVVENVSDTNVTVVIQGDSGVGKEVVARAIHGTSSRRKYPFVKVNCAAMPEGLLESELFGYEKGAFTGANFCKSGKFELADKGTIFLDEMGEMTPVLQAKLLQVMQDKQFTRLGGNEEIAVDVRVVCASNQPLLDMVVQKTFREDLYFRLNVVSISIPPLCERRDEIYDFINTFMRRYSAHYRKPCRPLSARLLKTFERYDFPGNVRELENMIKRIVVLESEDSILEELARKEAGERSGRNTLRALLEEIDETASDVPLREVGRRAALQAERETIEWVLKRTAWDRKQAAKLLDVSYKTLMRKIRACGLSVD
jgi:two-component system response regulator AtoC